MNSVPWQYRRRLFTGLAKKMKSWTATPKYNPSKRNFHLNNNHIVNFYLTETTLLDYIHQSVSAF